MDGRARGTLLAAALLSAVAVFLILALDLAGYQWLERVIMAFVGVIGLCYGFEVFLVHPDWRLAAFHTLIPTLDTSSAEALHGSIYIAVGMLGATVMPHVIYLHSALVQPRLQGGEERAADSRAARGGGSFLRFELIDVFVAMNGAWLINSAMIVMAAVAFFAQRQPWWPMSSRLTGRWGRCWGRRRRRSLRWRCCARGCRRRRWA